MKTDILKLYIGQKAIHNSQTIEVCGLNIYSDSIQNCVSEDTRPISEIKLILRPLSSMTEEEFTEYLKLKLNAVDHFNFIEKDLRGYGGFWYSVGNVTKPTFVMFTQIQDENRADQFQWLLSKGFDLFGLCESGEAINATEI